MILVLLGPPGVGKGTQGARIAVHYEIPTISTGAMFREAIARGTELGRLIQRYKIERGEYVPDEIVVRAVRERISAPDCRQGFLLDGFPRTIPQAEALDALLAELGCRLDAVLDFEAPMEEIIQRFSGRRVCPVDGSTYHIVSNPPKQPGICDICKSQLVMRPDDAPDVVKRRLEVYAEKTAPLLDYYRKRGLLYPVDANAEPETVFGRVMTLLDGLSKSPAQGSRA
ncbi:MAG TPA: adenylate kinase [Chthonomonadaceae bacterium]|nr:adenylate kinase [Chthonomonadaceae bacterium]